MSVAALNINTSNVDITPAGQPGNKMVGKIQESVESVKPENEKTEHARQEKQEQDNTKLAEKVLDVQNSLDVVKETKLQFSIHEATGEEMIIVSDKETGDLIREIPSEEFLDLAAKVEQMIGLIFDRTA